MGLDMYAFAYPREVVTSAVDFDVIGEGLFDEAFVLHLWRKHDDLHEWMEALYRSKGGAYEDFNLTPVVLTEADLLRLELAIRAGQLSETCDPLEVQDGHSQTDDDMTFVRKALDAMLGDFVIAYVAWW